MYYDPLGGLALLVLIIGLFWFLWKLITMQKDRNYLYLEDGLVRKVAEELKVNIEKEKFMQEYNPNTSRVRAAIEKKILKDYFKEEKEK